MNSYLSRALQTTRAAFSALLGLLRNPYVWAGLGLLVAVGGLLYLTVDRLVMPAYTRYDAQVTVPDVTNLPYEDAQATLAQYNLRAEQNPPRYRPDLSPDVVIDQNPIPATPVKPGRRIYLTVNSGRVPMVTVPAVVSLSRREAEGRIRALGLTPVLRADPIPSPYEGTITRQVPAPGDSLVANAEVTLYYSMGPGDAYVALPEVVGLPTDQAVAQLLERRLRYVFVDGPPPPSTTYYIARQSREAGTRVREGFELRLWTTPLPPAPDSTAQ
ncbi:MAG: PASTA domain-containing protein [Bacteroidota bacterium]